MSDTEHEPIVEDEELPPSLLSKQKVARLLLKYGYLIDKYYIYKETCRFMECIHVKTGNRIIVRIPPELDLGTIEHASNVLQIQRYDESEPVPTSHSQVEIAEQYDTNDRTLLSATIADDVQHSLNTIYKMNVPVDMNSASYKQNVMDIMNQIQRLKHVINTSNQYALCIKYLNLLIVHEDEYTDVYYVTDKSITFHDARQLMVHVTLDTFYDKAYQIAETCQYIHLTILRVLDRNFAKQLNMMDILVTQYSAMLNKIKTIRVKQVEYTDKLTEMYGMVRTLDQMETNASNDPAMSEKVCKLRAELVDSMSNVAQKLDNLWLCTDKVLYDNIMFYSNSLNNIQKLLAMKL